MGHAYLKAEAGPCRVLSICSGPESQIMEAMRRDGGKEKPAAGRKGKTKP
jgi:hypothetical protein